MGSKVVVPIASPTAKETIPLREGWEYRASDAPEGDAGTWSNAQPLPTSIHLDLLADGKIPDPFLAQNETEVQWVGTKTWIYRTRFTIPVSVLQNSDQKIVLVFDGLDTYTTVTLDDEVILETSNMFLSHRIDISERVRAKAASKSDDQAHTLQITFHNAEQKAEEEMKAHAEHSWFSFHFGSKRLAARKAQYHFGWDWCPVLKDSGPWKPIYLEIYQARVVDLSVRTHLSPDHREATLDIALATEGIAGFANIQIEKDGAVLESRLIDLSSADNKAVVKLRNPKLWWPWTLGQQNLYTAKAVLLTSKDDSPEKALDTTEKRFGIRRIELVRRPLRDREGSSFFFRVNGMPIFAAGSCWIPIDSFVTRGTPEKYRSWMQLAKDTNQVMIRVWGGGIYEHDSFFDACDELGLLVWHDFMFACGIYPAYSSFEESVTAEARQNLIRLRHHPSIALWCGNNEDYAIAYLAQLFRGAVKYNPEETDPSKIKESEFPARLFYELRLPGLCREVIPDIPYWPGSPFGGNFCNAATDGDIHQWHVWHLDQKPYQEYPQLSGRMVTEFGLQSIPHWKTVKQYFPAGKFSLDDNRDYTEDEFMVSHNKGQKGPGNIAKYGKDNIPFDETSLRGYIYCSQLIQSEGVSTAYRAWRRQWQGPGNEYCGGALVWQLNDCYPVSSWAIADCDLRPKMAYWAVKRENQPITAGLARTVKEGVLELEVWACNMTLHSIQVTYRVQAWNARTAQRVWSHFVSAKNDLTSNRSTELGKVQLNAAPGGGESTWSELVFAVHLFSADESGGHQGLDDRVVARSVNFHEPLKEVPFGTQDNRVTVRLVQQASGSLLELSSPVPTKGVYLDFETGSAVAWDDNGVDLVPGEVHRLHMEGFKSDAHKSVRVYWLGEAGWQSQVIELE
ncbi:beta-mannosidase [Aspergillus lucknowensis]|uniref:Beta-mannosidase B n=1 Tax=Aspergillus lucknowensis TaxID=176173 RepID=A0ABR4LDB9_9EURO